MKWIFWLAVVGTTGDHLSTWFCLTHRGHLLEEANPISSAGIEAMGLGAFLFAQWVGHMFLLTAANLLPAQLKCGGLAGWALIRWGAVVNNLIVLYMTW